VIKIKGVRLDKGRRGDLIELDPKDKILIAVKVGASKYDQNFVISADQIKVGQMRMSPNGDKLKKLYQNNLYNAEGEAVFTYTRRTTGVMLEPKKKKFKVEFCDCLDHNGIPEFDIKSFEIT